MLQYMNDVLPLLSHDFYIHVIKSTSVIQAKINFRWAFAQKNLRIRVFVLFPGRYVFRLIILYTLLCKNLLHEISSKGIGYRGRKSFLKCLNLYNLRFHFITKKRNFKILSVSSSRLQKNTRFSFKTRAKFY